MSNTEQQIKLILKLFVHFLFSCHVAFKCFIILSNSKYSIWRFLYWKLFLVWHFCLHTWNILNIDHRAHDVIYWCVWSPIETLFHVFPESCSLLFLSGGDDKPPVWSERCFTAALRCHSFKFWCIFRFFFFSPAFYWLYISHNCSTRKGEMNVPPVLVRFRRHL